MTDDLVPKTPSALDSFTTKLNLPEVIAGPAGKAISRLVAGALEIPAAYLDNFAQSIKDKGKARSIVSEAIANAAAKRASSDADIVARATHNLLAKEYRRQMNKEEIAKGTLQILQDEAKALPESNSHTGTKPAEVDEDWLNIFEKYAEDASTERMQSIWARILAREIRNPRIFSLAP
jgi:hypothetical protein